MPFIYMYKVAERLYAPRTAVHNGTPLPASYYPHICAAQPGRGTKKPAEHPVRGLKPVHHL